MPERSLRSIVSSRTVSTVQSEPVTQYKNDVVQDQDAFSLPPGSIDGLSLPEADVPKHRVLQSKDLTFSHDAAEVQAAVDKHPEFLKLPPRRVFIGPRYGSQKTNNVPDTPLLARWKRKISKRHSLLEEHSVTAIGESFEVGSQEKAAFLRAKARAKQVPLQPISDKLPPEVQQHLHEASSIEHLAEQIPSPLDSQLYRSTSETVHQVSSVSAPKKAVQFHPDFSNQDTARLIEPEPLSGYKPPADPKTVLKRNRDPQSTKIKQLEESADHIRKDFVLVKSGIWKKSPIPSPFREGHLKKYPIPFSRWEERVVVWRYGKLDVYQKSTRHGYKLESTISLAPTKTRVSIFSPSGCTLCLTSTRNERGRFLAGHQHEDGFTGSRVVCLRFMSTTLAGDYFYHLWRELGGDLPRSINALVPTLDVRVSLPLFPSPLLHEGESSWNIPYSDTTLTAEAAIATCVRQLTRKLDFKQMYQHVQDQGFKAHLAWRRELYLDWIKEDTTLDGKPRHWSLLVGAIMNEEPFSSHDSLELRIGVAYPTTAIIMPYQLLHEPPQCEGFLVRQHGAGRRERLYLATIRNHLLLLPALKATAPKAPLQAISEDQDQALLAEYSQFGNPNSVHPERKHTNALFAAVPRVLHLSQAEDSQVAEEYLGDKETVTPEEMLEKLAERERSRMCDLLHAAKGFIDLRDIEKITFPDNSDCDTIIPNDDVYLGESDSESSSETQASSTQPPTSESSVKFQLHLRGKRILRLEAPTDVVAKDWQDRLSALTKYWRARLHEDARLQVQASNDFIRLKLRHTQTKSDLAKDPFSDHSLSDYLSLAYNWSKLEDQAGINTSGRLYVKKEARARYKQRWLILSNGYLFMFRHVSHTLDGQPIMPVYHSSKGAIHLQDSYVVTGALCEEWVKTRKEGFSASDVNGHRAPRVYRDNLMSADSEEDCILVILKRPSADAKRSTTVLIARSKIERDAWLFSINAEIEKLARKRYPQEQEMLNSIKLFRDNGTR